MLKINNDLIIIDEEPSKLIFQLLISVGIAVLKYIPGISLTNEHSFALLIMMLLIISVCDIVYDVCIY